MYSDFLSSRLAAAKRQYNSLQHHQSSHLDRLAIDDFEMDEEVRPHFSCPYCYEDFDISLLCSHLEDEHSCESKVTARIECLEVCSQMVCPICSVKISRDMFRHITLHHGHLLKLQRRRRLRKVATPNSETLSLLSRDLREAHLQVLLGGGYRSNSSNVSTAPVDPFVSSLILNYPASELEEISKSVLNSAEDSSVKNEPLSHKWKTSFDPSLSQEEREKGRRRAAGRAGFMQDLLLTTLLGD